MKRDLTFIAVIALSLVANSCVEKRHSRYQSLSGEVWTTVFNITYDSNVNLADSIVSVLDKVGKSLSVFDESSVVAKVNTLKNTTINEDFINVYNMSKEINRQSGGRFDPTISPLITAWGFGIGHQATIDTTRIDEILTYVGIEKTHLDGTTLYKEDERIEFNFSAIAKGYGCDQIAEMFGRNGVENYLIEIGGEIRVGGKNEKGEAWKIAIDKPLQSDSGAVVHISQAVIAVTDCGIATSGNYRNYHTAGRQKYGHTISPTSGRPVQTDVLSATVIAPTAMEADAMATACLTMTARAAIALCDSLHRPAMLLLTDSTTLCTSPFIPLKI